MSALSRSLRWIRRREEDSEEEEEGEWIDSEVVAMEEEGELSLEEAEAPMRGTDLAGMPTLLPDTVTRKEATTTEVPVDTAADMLLLLILMDSMEPVSMAQVSTEPVHTDPPRTEDTLVHMEQLPATTDREWEEDTVEVVVVVEDMAEEEEWEVDEEEQVSEEEEDVEMEEDSVVEQRDPETGQEDLHPREETRTSLLM